MKIAGAHWPHLAHTLIVALLFGPTLFLGELPFFRDVTFTYYPDLVFLERALRAGVFPLWHPEADGGAPFFAPYPPHLALLLVFGAAWTLRLSVALHVLLAMSGASALARQVLGVGRAGAFVAGVAFGLSGVVLSSLLYPVFLAAAWAPWVVLCWARVIAGPGPRPAAALAVVAAVQLSTFGGEVCAQTALLALVLCPPPRVAVRALALAASLFAALATPVVLGAHALVEGSARAAGFSAAQVLAYSASPAILVEAWLPAFFGDLRGFSGTQFWGAELHPNGFPFFVSLYQGPLVLLLAAFARSRRLFVLAGVGLLATAGANGPFAALLAQSGLFRAPVKFMFLVALALALLAALGLERARGRGAAVVAVALAAPLILLGLAARADPAALVGSLQPLFPGLAAPHAALVLATEWPPSLLRVALLVVIGGAGLASGRRWTLPLALAAELLAANARLVPSAPASFFDLRPEIRDLLRPVHEEERGRLFSCGLCATPAVGWRGPRPGGGRDAVLYALERQALAPRTHVLDGLEGAFDEDRMALAPQGATLPAALRDPARLREVSRTLALGNVRWLLSWRPLPAELAFARGEAALAEVVEPLRLYELRGALPRVYWVPAALAVPDQRSAWAALRTADERSVVVVEATAVPSATEASGRAGLEYRPAGPHRVRVRADTPPGFVVVLDGFDPAWRVIAAGEAVPSWRANGRYRAWYTAGGVREFEMRYEPAWRGPAALGLAAGLLGLFAVLPPWKLDTSRDDA